MTWATRRSAASKTEVVGIDVEDGAIKGVQTSQGPVSAPVVVNCTAGWASLVSALAGVELPIITHPLQAAVTDRAGQPIEPGKHVGLLGRQDSISSSSSHT